MKIRIRVTLTEVDDREREDWLGAYDLPNDASDELIQQKIMDAWREDQLTQLGLFLEGEPPVTSFSIEKLSD